MGKTKNPIVTDATVIHPQGWSNMAMVHFNLEGEENNFGINFYNDNKQGIMYMYPALYRYADAPHDTKEISEQVLAILERKGESLYDSVGPWGRSIADPYGI
ncbi:MULTISPECIES: hypothetical protein [unclassified Paenibacillus]|uniref:hypothetical protein n=1 Tax=unclassified Paenibacillus TaxID=185978 RepID=UPI003643646D